MPSPPHTALAATTLRAGKAHEALLFRLAVELGCPLACELPPIQSLTSITVSSLIQPGL